MKYYIQRQLNEYGPYTLADLQRYVAQGSILLTDLARSEGMTDWVPVSQVLGNIPIPVPGPTTQPGAPAYGGGTVYGGPGTVYSGSAAQPMGDALVPVDFHWALVLLLAVITCGLFGWAWLFVEAVFVRKIKTDSKAILFGILAFATTFIGGVIRGLTRAMNGEANPIGGLLSLAGFVLVIVALFQMKSDLEDYYNTSEPIYLRLNGVMTFFFGILYFQHHLSRIAQWKKTGALQPQG
jgi:hypothetical protein